MNNELIEKKSWWKRNWKWFLTFNVIILISISIFFTSGMGSITTDLVQAYTDKELYDNALEMAKSDERVTELLGEIQQIDKLAILEGEVEYSNDNNTVNTTIRILGKKGKANLDISADINGNTWKYKKINIRIKSPSEKKQTIEIAIAE